MPLATVRNFYPDLGTAVTAITYLALTWGLLRLPLALAASTDSSTAEIPQPRRYPPTHGAQD
jgi:hypothetical protein